MFESFDLRGHVGYRFHDCYGEKCSVQESSLLYDEGALWIGIDDARPVILASVAAAHGVQTDKNEGWVPYPIPAAVLLHTRMHLTQSQVRELLPMLQHFAEHGELPRPTTPTPDEGASDAV